MRQSQATKIKTQLSFLSLQNALIIKPLWCVFIVLENELLLRQQGIKVIVHENFFLNAFRDGFALRISEQLEILKSVDI